MVIIYGLYGNNYRKLKYFSVCGVTRVISGHFSGRFAVKLDKRAQNASVLDLSSI